MRIFSGTARGRFVNAPQGATLRPTTDRVRLAVFNAVGALVPDSHFMDLFCGSGSMGLEALSRGARRVSFVDSQRACIEAVRASAKAFGFEEPRWSATFGDFRRALTALGRSEPVDLVYADPPYDAALGPETLKALVASKLLAAKDTTRVLLEHSSEAVSPEAEGLTLYRRYDHGAASVSVYGLDAVRQPD